MCVCVCVHVSSRYADNMESHLQSLVLQHMPSNLQKLDRSKAGKDGTRISTYISVEYVADAVTRPNMDSYVFVRAVERTEQVNVDPG